MTLVILLAHCNQVSLGAEWVLEHGPWAPRWCRVKRAFFDLAHALAPSQSSCSMSVAFPSQGCTVWTAEMEPGDILLVPAGWWHRVTSCGASLSVGCFLLQLNSWRDLRALVVELVLLLLHYCGLYGTTECACHPRGHG